MNRIDISKQANNLRKSGNYEEAKKLYIELWRDERDKFVASGLLHCFRKLGNFEEAFELIETVESDYSDFQWWILECTWAIIQGKINVLPDNIETKLLVEVAQEVINLNPEMIALKSVVFKVLKSAKKNGDWDVVLEWIDKINPDDLEKQSDIKKDWSDQELWYYYKITALVKTGDYQPAIDLASTAEDLFPSKRKFIIREKAKAEIGQENILKGEEIYKELVKSRNADWWLLHEYGKILHSNGKSEEAFLLFCKAALSRQGLIHHKIKLMSDIGDYFIHKNEPDSALLHYKLVYNLRKKKGWNIPDQLLASIKLGQKESDIQIETLNLIELLNRCRDIWVSSIPKEDLPKYKVKTKNLRGKVMLGPSERPFCFIKTKKKDSYFCYKSELPSDIDNNQLIEFDLKKTFDKKKQVDSWKAVNIKLVSN